MSAFMVSTTHIDAMLTAGVRWGIGNYGPLRWMARELTEEDKQHAYAAGQPWGPEAGRLAQELSRTLTSDTADRVGAMLLAENRRSVDFRYDESDIEEFYSYRELRGTPDPVTVLAAIACYRYQACEHPDWKGSEAFLFCEALEGMAIRRLPGYESAPWEITDRNVFMPKPAPVEEPKPAPRPYVSAKDAAAIIRHHLRQLVPGKVSVRVGRGTAASWIDISGEGQWGTFSEAQVSALRALGFNPGMNFLNVSPGEREHVLDHLAEVASDHGPGCDGPYNCTCGAVK